MDIPGLLRAARAEQAITKRALALRVGIAPSTLSRFEAGTALPSLPMLDRILAACGRDADWTLVRRHADLDGELRRLAALPLAARVDRLGVLALELLRELAQCGALVGGAWAAALHAIPTSHERGRLWLPATSGPQLAGIFRARFLTLLVDGQRGSVSYDDELFERNRDAEWSSPTFATFRATVVPPGGRWPDETRIDAEGVALRTVRPAALGPDDGVRPEVLARWLALRPP